MAMGAAMAVGPALWGEGFHHIAQCRAKLVQHVADYMVALDQQAIGLYLAGHVTVAYMPGETQNVIACHLQKRLICRADTDFAPVVQHKGVACIKRLRGWKIDQKPQAAIAGQHFAP